MAFFQFNMEFHKVGKGNNNTNIRNPISPLISEVLMAALEMKLKKMITITARVWWRYVDDVFTTVKISEIEFVNSIHRIFTVTNIYGVSGKNKRHFRIN